MISFFFYVFIWYLQQVAINYYIIKVSHIEKMSFISFLSMFKVDLEECFANLHFIAPDSGQTILEVHLYVLDLGEIIPTSEKRPVDFGETIPTSENLAPDWGQIIPISEKRASDLGQISTPCA